jgi:hypothetical protein
MGFLYLNYIGEVKVKAVNNLFVVHPPKFSHIDVPSALMCYNTSV